jgi:hypothetical protein
MLLHKESVLCRGTVHAAVAAGSTQARLMGRTWCRYAIPSCSKKTHHMHGVRGVVGVEASVRASVGHARRRTLVGCRARTTRNEPTNLPSALSPRQDFMHLRRRRRAEYRGLQHCDLRPRWSLVTHPRPRCVRTCHGGSELTRQTFPPPHDRPRKKNRAVLQFETPCIWWGIDFSADPRHLT